MKAAGNDGDDQYPADSWAASVVASYNNDSDNDSILLTHSAPFLGKSRSASASRSGSVSGSTAASEPKTVGPPNANGEEKKRMELLHSASTPIRVNGEGNKRLSDPPGPSPPQAQDSPHDLSSAKNSAFRRSLDEEAKAKDRRRQQQAPQHSTSIAESKQMLRDSIRSLSSRADDHGQPLTRPERNFLEALLASDGPGVAEACAAAHRALTDGNLFWTICGGSAGEVESLVPGHVWSARSDTPESFVKLKDGATGSGSGDWVQDWVSRGSQSSNDSNEKRKKEKEKKNESEKQRGMRPMAFVPAVEGLSVKEAPLARSDQSIRSSSGASLSSSFKDLLGPYELERKSSMARLERLQHRRRQSFAGKDTTNRLFKAHEVGLVVTPHGSARRSLMRMGLPMEKGLYGAPPPPMPLSTREALDHASSLPLDKETILTRGCSERKDPNTTILAGDTTLEQQVHPTVFEKALAKMDERTIRRIEKEERAKRRAQAEEDRVTAVSEAKSPLMMGGGCSGGISPLSMSVLRKMFASKQFSFHRQSSSYTRFDSFLTSETGGSGHLRTESGLVSESTYFDSDEQGEMRKDIFRPSPRPSTAEERLRNLLINAGFQNMGEDEAVRGLVADAQPEDDADIMSTSTNSVALLLKGGPSYRDAEMFRGEKPDSEVEKDHLPTEILAKKKGHDANDQSDTKKVNLSVHTTSGSAVFSLESPPRANDQIIENIESPRVESKFSQSPGAESKVSPAGSDLGELPTIQPFPRPGLSNSVHTSRPSHSAQHKRSTTTGVLKGSTHSTGTPSSSGGDPSRGRRYKRSVSWGHTVFSKEEVRASMASAMSRQDSISSTGMATVISFPHLRRAAPLRSDSIGSNASTLLSFPPPLKLGAPLRSESVGSVASVASVLSPVPSLRRAQPVFSPRPSSATSTRTSTATATLGPPPLARAHSIRSESQQTVTTAAIDGSLEICSVDSEENDRPAATRGAAWESPLVSTARKGLRPPLHGRGLSSSSSAQAAGADGGVAEPKTFTRQASASNYEGVGIEVEEILSGVESIEHARKHRSLMSQASDYSVGGLSHARSQSRTLDRSHCSQRSGLGIVIPAPQTLDDGFIIKNIDFERYSSEILRSLSNEDLYSSHHLETINGGPSKGSRNINELSSTDRIIGESLNKNASWDLDSNGSLNLVSGPSGGVNAWGVLEDDYAEEYGAHGTLPFRILGTSADDTGCHPHVLSPPLMESLQNFMPPTISENNYWLKYSLVRDGASLPSLLRHVRGTKNALIAIETVDGEVFGSFTSTPWRKNWNYFGTGESFLWRMRRTRSEKDAQYSVLDQAMLESNLDIFYWSGRNDLIQYCTQDMLAVGGGSLLDNEDSRDDAAVEQREPPPTNPVFSKAVDKGGFGLAIDAELLRGTSSPCATFNSPPLTTLHANGSPFEILNLEVWTMTPCENITEAENLEMRSLFLEAYSSA